MSKDIKVGDWVRVTHGVYEGKEFPVEKVKKSDKDTAFGKRYVVNETFAALGVWFKDLEKIENPTAIAFLEMPVGTQFKVHVPSLDYTDPTVYIRTESGYKSVEGHVEWSDTESDSKFWTDYEILPIEDKPEQTTENIINAVFKAVGDYRSELVADLHSISAEARPIRQAKLTAVGEILDRLRWLA